jgi:hypothetical protein
MIITAKQKKQNQRKDILFILVSSFIVVVAWIAFNIYHINITSTISQAIQLQLLPISPKFDDATMQQLKTRENIVPQFSLQQGASQSAGTPSPTISALSQPSPQAVSPQTSSDSSGLVPTNAPFTIQGQ